MFVNFACLARYSWIHSERKLFYSYIFYLYWNSIIFFWFASSSLFRPQIVPFLLLNKSDEDHVCLQVLWNMISTDVMLCGRAVPHGKIHSFPVCTWNVTLRMPLFLSQTFSFLRSSMSSSCLINPLFKPLSSYPFLWCLLSFPAIL